jgi:hypothetical protein
MAVYKPTIESVLDMDTGRETVAANVFALPEQIIFNLRRRQEEAYKEREEPKYVCYYCKQPTKIKGGPPDGTRKGKKQLYFAHFKDSDDCPIKTNSKLTQAEIDAMKFNGAKESGDHIRTKNMIGEFLELNERHEKGASEIIIDQILKSQKIQIARRKPDVRCKYLNRQLVFEIQLSTTYISVISDREHFYKQEGAFLIWVFKEFHQNKDEQTFTEKDIYYANFENVFVLDEEAIQASAAQDDLVLHCYYNEHSRNGNVWDQEWVDVFVTLSDLTFDEKTAKVFYYNPEKHLKQLQAEYDEELREQVRKEEERTKQNERILAESMEKARLAQEIKLKEEEERKRLEAEKQKKKDRELRRKELESQKKLLALTIEQTRELDYNYNIRHQNSDVAFSQGNNAIYKQAVASTERTTLINKYLVNGETILEDLKELFTDGYRPTEIDYKFLDNQFKLAVNNHTNIAWRRYISQLAITVFYLKVNNLKFFEIYPKIKSILLGVLSIKLNKAIAPKLLSIQEFSNNLLAAFPEYRFLLIKALTYFQPDLVLNIPMSDTKQIEEHNWILITIFPELF